MIVTVYIVLKDNIDKNELLFSLDSSKAQLYNLMEAIPNMIVLEIDKDYYDTLKNNERILSIEEREFQAVPAGVLPNFYSMTKGIVATIPSTNGNGSDYAPLQFYLDTDQIYSSQTLGVKDTFAFKADATYSSRWTGKHVDIVSLEVGPIEGSQLGIHSTHPDFQDPDNPGSSRIIPMNWTDLEETDNNQISTNSVLSAHGQGVLSAAAGTICGFAKKANLRVMYLVGGDDPVECINAAISWHNSKAVNPLTGVKNPTILIHEYQYLTDRNLAVRLNDIDSINDQGTTISRPVGGWGTNLTPFTSRNIIPFKVLIPDTGVWEWCIVLPAQNPSSSLRTALEAAWDAGIVNIVAAGNNGGVYVKQSDPRWSNVSVTLAVGFPTVYQIQRDLSNLTNIVATTTFTNPHRCFYTYGPAGYDKAIDVAAGQNSETYPILDPYSNRGPGIDLVGLGATTWTAYPVSTYADGFFWGMFSGTSCAAPTVAGKIACMMERYFTYNNVYPTPDQIKTIALAEAKDKAIGVDSTTWSNVPAASTDYSVNEFAGSTYSVNTIRNGIYPNGSFRLADLAGTTTKRGFFNAQSFSRIFTTGKRPVSGAVYPRPKIKKK